MLQKELKLA